MVFFEYLFYGISFFFVILEAYKIQDTDKWLSFFKRLKKGKKLEYVSKANGFIYILISFFYLFWIFIGCMSSQWFLFIALFLIGFLDRSGTKAWKRVFSSVKIMMLLFIVFNKFHLGLTLL